MNRPFFTIGVTTYNRMVLLKRALDSIHGQTFTDFEVIVGNDYQAHTYTSATFGLTEDSRFRFINYPINQGETNNMNALLADARGQYFTWLADDDLYLPDFLLKCYEAIQEHNQPSCVFTGFDMIYDRPSKSRNDGTTGSIYAYSGREFLRGYLSGRLRLMGTNGMFRLNYLKKLGGVRKLSDIHFALYAEYLLIVQAGLLPKVVYVDMPLVLYYHHQDSWGCSNRDVELYQKGGVNLITHAVEILRSPLLINDFKANLRDLLKIPTVSLIDKLSLHPKPDFGGNLILYRNSLIKQFATFQGRWLYRKLRMSLFFAGLTTSIYAFKTWLKTAWKYRPKIST